MLLKSGFRLLRRAGQKIVPTDISHILCVHRNTFQQPRSDTVATFEVLSNAELHRLALENRLGTTLRAVTDCNRLGHCAIAARVDGQPAGISFFAGNNVLGRHNRGGQRFKGIGMALPRHTLYQYKSFIDPAFRGRELHGGIVRHALTTLHNGDTQTVVASVSAFNGASLRSFRKLGFRSTGIAVEAVIGRWHLYRLPRAIERDTGVPIDLASNQPAIALQVHRQPDDSSLPIV